MGYAELFTSKEYLNEKEDMFVMDTLIERMADEKPFRGAQIVVGHLLAINSLTMLEALHLGGAEIVLCLVHDFVREKAVGKLLRSQRISDLPKHMAVKAGDYFIDEAAELGKTHTPIAAAEITRTGELAYREIDCPVISVDRSRVKHFEDFLGTGDSFVRAWENFNAGKSLQRKRVVQFGYGKVGRGVAHKAHQHQADIVVVDVVEQVCERARNEGFECIHGVREHNRLKEEVRLADIVIGVTGIPGAVGRMIKRDWFPENRLPVMVNMGYDEFGDGFDISTLLGNSKVPVNLTLEQPTLNRYIDTALAAQVMAMEVLVTELDKFSTGVHALPDEIDKWVVHTWHEAWPNENLDGIREELGL